MEEWRFIDFGLVDIRDMMAMDEAILKGDEGNTFFFWTPKKSIILGFFQKAEVELNLPQCKDYTITRRISGGGIAFSDDRCRQINYGVVGTIDNDLFPLDIIESYKQVCGVLIDTLVHYGMNAAFRPINDVTVDNKKISGNAQTRWEGKLLQNGTLLLDFDIEEMLRISNIPREKFLDKKIASVREGLTWLDRELGEQRDMEEVKKVMKDKFEERFRVTLKTATLSKREKELTKSLLPKYYSPEWVYR
ncbi:MAG: lipoate--protein ligase family protein [Euryarchaeota archaeon]|nr:lipoate--protein ligase family protein [Euryarchaeota archaeon]MBU4223514.1 lipoate--protein ligase family protein [Euryarchaeota archaeon]MBU4454418.1 lipoate--protein ligase family protein [Euryarchaeota archaeon]MCG2734799.1 lipoate--protein ligase family protein [Candidatus Methanoperedenaceae archaeon]